MRLFRLGYWVIMLAVACVLPPISCVFLRESRTYVHFTLALYIAGIFTFLQLQVLAGVGLVGASMVLALISWSSAWSSEINGGKPEFFLRVCFATAFAVSAIFAGSFVGREHSSVDAPKLVAEGQVAFQQCAACHSTGVGPNLRSIIGRRSAAVPGYGYSEALMSLDITWTSENLAEFLQDPSEFAPGTNMAVSGIKDDDIASIVAYLEYLSH